MTASSTVAATVHMADRSTHPVLCAPPPPPAAAAAGPQDCSNVVAVNVTDPYWANTGVTNGAVGTCLSGYEFDDFDATTLGVPGAVMLFK